MNAHPRFLLHSIDATTYTGTRTRRRSDPVWPYALAVVAAVVLLVFGPV